MTIFYFQTKIKTPTLTAIVGAIPAWLPLRFAIHAVGVFVKGRATTRGRPNEDKKPGRPNEDKKRGRPNRNEKRGRPNRNEKRGRPHGNPRPSVSGSESRFYFGGVK
jgi:hypothetical protein